MEIGTIVFWVIVVAIVIWIVSIYNGLVRDRNDFKNAFSQIDVQLQRRYDLIPNLVETANGYIKHERETLEAVIEARNGAQQASRSAAAHPEDGAAIGALGAAEGYPDLKANTTMRQLMEELSSTENRVAFSRQAFNDAVMAYNNQREQFPNNFVAGPFNFAAAELLEIPDEQAREAVKVSF